VPRGILGFRDHMFARKVQQEGGKMQEGREMICAKRQGLGITCLQGMCSKKEGRCRRGGR
jgi:hypothetical protein